jgi:hypothetical protein
MSWNNLTRQPNSKILGGDEYHHLNDHPADCLPLYSTHLVHLLPITQ